MSRYRWTDDELDGTVSLTSAFVAGLSYRMKRAHGLVDRLQTAIREDCKLAVDSLAARKLRHDALTLHALARELEGVAQRLTRG